MTKETTFNFEDVDNTMDFKEAPMMAAQPVEIEEEAPKLEVEQEASKVETPAEDDNKISKELEAEYLTIYDSIMFEDKFEKEYKLGKKYFVKFSTRSADSDISISRQLDGMDFSTMHALQTMSAVLTMSHSLVNLNGKDLSGMTVAERYNYIRAKSSHLIESLSAHMISFDRLVRSALEYGEANF